MSEEKVPYVTGPRPGKPACSFCGTGEVPLGYTMLRAPEHEDQLLLFTCAPCGAMATTELFHSLMDGQRKAWIVARFPQLYPEPIPEEVPKKKRKRR